MKYRIIALLALILAGTLAIRAAYSWYLIDTFAGGVVNSTNWQQNDNSYASKVAISKLAIPDGSVDHEVRSTLPATCPGTHEYLHLLRATSNYDNGWLGDAYRIMIRLDVPNCIMTLNVSKVTSANGWTQLLNLTSQPYPAGATWRSFVRNDGPSPGVTVILGDQQWTLNDTSLTTGKPGVGHNGWPYPRNSPLPSSPSALVPLTASLLLPQPH